MLGLVCYILYSCSQSFAAPGRPVRALVLSTVLKQEKYTADIVARAVVSPVEESAITKLFWPAPSLLLRILAVTVTTRVLCLDSLIYVDSDDYKPA